MSGIVLKTSKEIYRLKYGLNSLMELEQFCIRVENNFETLEVSIDTLKTLLYYGLDGKLDFPQIDEIIKEVDIKVLKTAIKNSMFMSLGNLNNASWISQIEELYITLVGEMEMAPDLFFKMTPHEIEMYVEGYNLRRENRINDIIIALKSEELFSLSEELGYSVSTIEEKNKVLRELKVI